MTKKLEAQYAQVDAAIADIRGAVAKSDPESVGFSDGVLAEKFATLLEVHVATLRGFAIEPDESLAAARRIKQLGDQKHA